MYKCESNAGYHVGTLMPATSSSRVHAKTHAPVIDAPACLEGSLAVSE